MRLLFICIISILSWGAIGQNKPLDIPEGISEKDFQTIASFKQNMAKHINPNPDSALYYIHKIKALSTQLNYQIGLFEADHLQAHYHRRLQQFDSAIVYFNLSLQIAHEIDYNKGIAVSNNGLCRTYYTLGEMEKALNACEKCIVVAKELKDMAIIPDTYIAFGNIYLRQNDLKQSLKYFLKVDSLHSIEAVRPDIIAAAFQSLGTIYQELKDYDKSEEYFLKANEEFQKMPIDPTFYLNTTKWHLGEIYYYKGQTQKADSLLKESYDFFSEIKDGSTVAQISIYLGLINLQNNQIDAAEKFLLEGFRLHKENGNAFETSVAALELGKLYVAKKQSSEALKYLNEALKNNNENSATRQEVLLKLADAYALEKNYSKAFELVQQGMLLKDSLNDVQNAAKIRELEAIYQTEKQDQEIELLTTQNDLAEQQNKNQRNLFIAGGAILGLAFIGLFFLYRNKQKTNTKLKELDRLKSNFFANISHELRTPLTLISGPVQQMLENKDTREKDRPAFEMIDRNNKRLLELVNQVLDLSKLEAGSLKLQVEKANVLNFIGAIADSFTYTADQKGLKYTREIDSSVKESWFDKDALEKILVNLLSNAMKYSPENGTVIFCAALQNDQLMVEVKNTGKGLTKEQVKKIFERFYQGNENNEGVGIGLALVRELVTLHKGTISVDSKADKWTSFKVTLPVSEMAYQDIAIRKSSTPKTVSSVPVSNFPAPFAEEDFVDSELPILLVVDDNADIRALLKSNFESGYNVLTANDGAKGIQLAVEHIPDLIISDVMMPVKDGIALANELKNDERTSHIPIILLTAKAGEENELEGIETGADDYITKPFSNKILRSKVAKLIELRKQLQARYSQDVFLKPKDIAITPMDEQFFEKVQFVLDEKLVEPAFSAEEFSKLVNMSRMQLHRKLKALTGLSASAFIRSQRLKLATQLLKKADINISQIGFAVGFNDHSYFTKCFRETYECTPSEYANRA